jgi:hypothetical protein
VSIVEAGEEALSVLKIVSLEAGEASTGIVVSLALIGDSNAHLLVVESPSVGALEADLVVPVPGSASGISGLGVVEVGEEALSVLEVVSLEASNTGTGLVVSGAEIGDGNANLLVVESPTGRALEADLVVPVPGGAASISGLGVVELGEEALSVLEVVSLEAGKASTGIVVGLALIGNGHTDFVGIESPLGRALKADLVEPIPGSAARVSGLCVVEVREEALSVLEIVSEIACKAVSAIFVSFTLISNRDANLVSIGEPSAGAFQADLVVPVPSSAAEIGGLGIVTIGENALSVFEVVSLEASNTGTGIVVSFAEIGNSNAHFLVVEGPSVGALEAGLVVPVPCSTS